MRTVLRSLRVQKSASLGASPDIRGYGIAFQLSNSDIAGKASTLLPAAPPKSIADTRLV